MSVQPVSIHFTPRPSAPPQSQRRGKAKPTVPKAAVGSKGKVREEPNGDADSDTDTDTKTPGLY